MEEILTEMARQQVHLPRTVLQDAEEERRMLPDPRKICASSYKK